MNRFLSGALIGATVFWGSNAIAAETVVLKYRILRESVSVQELTKFAETGELSSDLQAYFKMSGQKPETVRQTLTKEVRVNPVLLDRVLNSKVGNTVLDPLGEAIQTPKGGAERESLRSAITLSVSGDGKFSILEILQKYPTQEVVLDGDRAEVAYNHLNELAEQVKTPLGNILNRIKF
jgi:Alpha/beta hydrolase of unknown function (DUF1400)